MSNSVFFAWQNDTEPNDNKSFIWDSICESCKALSNDVLPEVSPRPEKDTEGISGSPNIVQTIFRKIDQCSIFVADVTFVAKTENGKFIPNPNVLLELGYAVKTIGWERTILVLNNAYGKAENLPFDLLQHRWPIEYRVTSETKARKRCSENLDEALSSALNICEEFSLNRAIQMMNLLDTNSLKIVADHENGSIIELFMPAKTKGDLLESMAHTSSLRRLMDLGAIKVVEEPYISYGWTSDGLLMIREINKTHPKLLELFRSNSN